MNSFHKLIKKDFPKEPVINMLTGMGDAKDALTAANLPEISEFYSRPLTPELWNTIIKNYFNLN